MTETRKRQDDVDFEMKFYEGIVAKKPDFIEALIALGDLYTKKGFYKRGLDIDKQLAHLKPHDPYVLYNLACSHSLLHEIDKAWGAIKQAIDCGYDDWDYLEADQDLFSLRQAQQFQEFLAKVKK